MDKKAIQLDLSMAEEVLPLLEHSLARARQEHDEAAKRVVRLEVTVEALRAKINGEELPLPGTHRRRMKKGEAEEMIFNLFEAMAPGTALTLAQIKARTGMKHATVYRSLHDPKRNRGRFLKEGKGWKAAPREPKIRL